jgi:L-fucose isomerase-like protein
MPMKKVDVIVCASDLHDRGVLAELKSTLLDEIGAAGGFQVTETLLPTPDRLTAVLILTGGVERQALKAIAQLPTPTLLIAHPGHNSLPASLEVLAKIRQDGGEGRILFGSAEELAAELGRELAITKAWERFRFSRVGMIGEPSDWLVASDVDRAFLKGRLSIELVDIDIEDLIARIEAESPTKRSLGAFVRKATETVEPTGDDLKGAGGIYRALRAIVDENRLAACTVRCFELVKRLDNTGCYALARLNDEGIPAGCEGDMQSMFSLYAAYLLTGQTAFMGNIASVDVAARAIGVAHCTCPVSMVAAYSIRSHFESGLGVAVAGTMPEGDCTLFRMGGERLDHLFIREGRVEAAAFRDDLCRTQVRVQADGPVDELLRTPLGNHHILLAGHHRTTIERFFGRYLAS